jgi:hypothetical protein
MSRVLLTTLAVVLLSWPVQWFSDLIGLPSLMDLWGLVMLITISFNLIRWFFFPGPIAVVLVEPRPRRRWLKWPSNRPSNQ